jgi:hypothetical protein
MFSHAGWPALTAVTIALVDCKFESFREWASAVKAGKTSSF